jgi:hypothetical protein
VRSAFSYLCANDRRLNFGLGSASRVERITVRWPSGAVESVQGVKADQAVTISEGKGVQP